MYQHPVAVASEFVEERHGRAPPAGVREPPPGPGRGHRRRQQLRIHEALERLAGWDARQAAVVELRFFVGLSVEEAATVLGVSAKTVMRDWAMARAWLQRELAATR